MADRIPSARYPSLSGDRFAVVYRIVGREDEARAAAADLCIEQTVEFPIDLVPPGPIREEVVGRVESLDRADEAAWRAHVSFAVETAGGELTQLLNVVFGNTSLKPGVRVERLLLTDTLCRAFAGPRFGREGMREVLGVHDRPILCSAVKPMGLSAEDLAEWAYRFALGGIDLVKDDHGLANQPFAAFERRVSLCAAAVQRANRETGRRCLYVPNVTAGANDLTTRARFAKSAGCGGVLVAPGLVGLDAMRGLAGDDSLALPILSHPAFLGSFVTSPDSGISPFALFGQIARLAGADAAIFPHCGGRFPFSRADCLSLVAGTAEPMGPIRTAFPVPGGGMTLTRLPELVRFYGTEAILLIGGDLFRHGPDVTQTCREFRRRVEEAAISR